MVGTYLHHWLRICSVGCLNGPFLLQSMKEVTLSGYDHPMMLNQQDRIGMRLPQNEIHSAKQPSSHPPNSVQWTFPIKWTKTILKHWPFLRACEKTKCALLTGSLHHLAHTSQQSDIVVGPYLSKPVIQSIKALIKL